MSVGVITYAERSLPEIEEIEDRNNVQLVHKKVRKHTMPFMSFLGGIASQIRLDGKATPYLSKETLFHERHSVEFRR